MARISTAPCEHCQKALHKHQLLEYLYCGHNHVIAYRFPDGHLDFVEVASTGEAIELIQESGQASQPVQVTA